MAEALGKKRKVRGGYRAYVTTVIAEVNEILPNYQPDQQTDLRKFKITLKEQLDNLKNLDEQIIELIDEKEINEEVANAGKYRSEVHEIILKIDQVLGSNAVNNQSTVVSQASASNGEKKMVARLPKLELKGFSGDPTTWMSFWDSFSSAVDQNEHLSEVDKFNHLKSLLHGKAATTIAGLSLTSANYKAALDLLKGRYANKQVIISSHMERLLKLPSIPSGDVRKLRELFDLIEAQIRALQALGVESTSYGSLLTPVILEKLPNEMKLIVSRKLDKEVWELRDLLEVIQNELTARERCSLVSESEHRRFVKPGNKSFEKSSNTGPTTAAALLNPSRTVSCTYCRKSHPSAKCQVVSDIAARRNLLRKSGRCFLCLRKNHLARDCTSPNKCLNCSQVHHVSICPRLIPSVNLTGQSHIAVQNQQNPGQATGIKFKEFHPSNQSKIHVANSDQQQVEVNQTQGTVGMVVDIQTSILLQTACAVVSKPTQPECSAVARILLDSGSQKTYITYDLKERLN